MFLDRCSIRQMRGKGDMGEDANRVGFDKRKPQVCNTTLLSHGYRNCNEPDRIT